MSLKGKVVAIVRPQDQVKELSDAIESLGGIPYVAPLIEVKPAKDQESLIKLIKDTASGRLDIIAFMSQNGVKQTFETAKNEGLEKSFKGHIKKISLISIGPKTKHELEKIGFSNVKLPEEYSSYGLIKLLEKTDLKGKRIGFTILAWLVSHFSLHIAFAAVNNNNPPMGLIALINICVAGAVYYFTGGKDKPTS